jgi:5'-3' exonuclease
MSGMKIHIVDGTYELFRAYFGSPPKTSPDGREVGATLGLMRSLLGLIRGEKVTHIACAFDHVVESFRNKLFDGYKTGEGIDPDLFAQFPLAEQGARALGIVVWPMIEFEADDAMATAAARWAKDKRVEQIVLCTVDKDLAQCVQGQEIIMLDRRRQFFLDEDGVREKYGVPPESIPDWLALVGDSADGIPGLYGWGKKTAEKILTRYGHLESIPKDPAEWEFLNRRAPRLVETLTSQWDNVLLYRELATLRTDVNLPEKLDGLKWKGARRSQLEAFCKKLGDSRLVERVWRWRE